MIRGNYQPALYGNIFNASEFEVPESVTDKPEGGTHRIDGPLRQDEFPGLQSPPRSFARNCHRVVQKIPTLEWPFAINKLHMNSSKPVRPIAKRAHGCKEGQVVLLAVSRTNRPFVIGRLVKSVAPRELMFSVTVFSDWATTAFSFRVSKKMSTGML